MKRLVVLNFFPAFVPPKSGGELRLYNLYAALSRRFRIDLVSWTLEEEPASSVRLTETFTDHRVPKGAGHRESYECFARLGIEGEAAGISCALAGRGETEYHSVAARLITEADAVVHEFPYTLDYDRTIDSDGKPRIYNAHNLEAEMARHLTSNRAVHDLVFALERRLVAKSALVFATSEAERLRFHCLYGAPLERLAICPNGIAAAEYDWAEGAAGQRERAPAQPLSALFLGSDHPPNLAAAHYILDTLAPSFPATDFVIGGSVCAGLPARRSGNVALLGKLDAEAKHEALARADIFVNPIRHGAGTSLKVLEAMAAALPVLTTEAGARGLDLEDGKDAAVAPLERFPSRLLALLARPALRAELGEAARATALGRFDWRDIADRAGERIAELLGQNLALVQARPLVLVANDYSVAMPVAGGALRIHRLMSRVARDADVVHLCFGRSATVEIEALAPRFHEVRVPRTPDHAALVGRVNAGNSATVDDVIAALAATLNPDLLFYYRRLAARAATVVFSHPYLLPLLQVTGKQGRVVLDMHNVEATLKAALLRDHRDADLLLPVVAALEAYGIRIADDVVTVAAEDAATVATLYGGQASAVVANGADPCPEAPVEAAIAAREARDWREGFTAVFIGSGHPPNVTAARFLAERVLPALPAMRLRIVGAVAESLHDLAGMAGLDLVGRVSDEERRGLLLMADVALNPVIEGSGSNLKMADYFSHGLPVVTTPQGGRGFALTGEAVIAEPHGFPAALDRLATRPGERTAMARRGRALAEGRLSWATLGEAFAAIVAPLAPRKPLRLLVVTYRYGEPPPGGAEAYLARLLEALDATGEVTIDLMAPAVGQIVNLSRFIARAEPEPDSTARFIAPFLRRLSLFPPDVPDEKAESAACWRLFRLWQAESLTLGRKVAQGLDRPLLLGGWNAPSRAAGSLLRWSTGKSEIFVPRGHAVLRLAGVHESGQAPIQCRVDGAIAAMPDVTSPFSIELTLPPARDHIVELVMAPHRSEDALVEIAFALTLATVIDGNEVERPIDLGEDYESFASRHRTEDWVAWSVETAEARSAEAEADFHALRGPHSRALLAALKTEAPQYDVVLVQGMAFGLASDAVRVTRGAGVPAVAVPHLHVEDRFYHWRDQHRMLADAAGVLCFSAGVASGLVARLGGHPVIMPGGGVDPAEFAWPMVTVPAFRSIHRADRPYFLVLGRKSGSKRCDVVIEAWRSAGEALGADLVFVGADEGVVIPAMAGLHDYGELPREAVLGALAGAIALVTMSESESFGIVLLESWMSGRPVIAQSGTLAFAELVSEGIDGLLVRDAAELAAAMRRLAADAKAAEAMGASGRAKAEAYAWPTVATRLRDALIIAAATPSQHAGIRRPVRPAG
ncbi:MAG TPA: glycosyltransferase [Stellaceae bacterium]|nr:glycosyltransferase [Stellaceae bacterium]